MRDDRDDSNGGKVKRFSYASSKADREATSPSDEWELLNPKKKQGGGPSGLGELDDVWSIRKNVSLGSGPMTKNSSSIPAVNSSLTANTGFYSRHGQYNNMKTGQNHRISPTANPSGFPKTSGFSWNQPRSGGYSYSQQEGNSSSDFPQASSSGGLQPPGRTATHHTNTRNMQMGAVYPRSPKPDRHSPHTQHNAKGRPGGNWHSY